MKLNRKNKKLRRFYLTIFLPLLIFITITMINVPTIKVVKDKIVLGAHRGNSVEFIENTIPAFESALKEDRYNFVEFDVQYTKDKIAIVYHDKSLWRLQSKIERIQDLTYEELENISEFHIPTFNETMNLLAGKKPLTIEIKSQGFPEDDEKLADLIISECKKRNILYTVNIISISSEVIKYINKNYENIFTGRAYYVSFSTFLPFEAVMESYYEELDTIGADNILIHGTNLQNIEELIATIPKNKTLTIWYFTDEMYIINPKKDSWLYSITPQEKEKVSILEKIKQDDKLIKEIKEIKN